MLLFFQVRLFLEFFFCFKSEDSVLLFYSFIHSFIPEILLSAYHALGTVLGVGVMVVGKIQSLCPLRTYVLASEGDD